MKAATGIVSAVEEHTKAAVDHLPPPYSTAIMNGNPGSTPESVANDILDGHVLNKL